MPDRALAECARRQENMARRAAGEDELTEDVPAQFKPPPEPSQLDYYLIANQISNYCDQARHRFARTWPCWMQ